MINQHSKYFPDSFYRVSVKGLCVVKGKLLLVKESPELSGQWELPGGGLDFGEDPQTGLAREIKEEMGLEVVSVSEHPFYAWPNLFEQKRKLDWYYSMVLAYRIELKDFNFTNTDECEAIDFFTEGELQKLDIHQQSLPLRQHFKVTDFN